MKPFMNEDFMLSSPTAAALYHDFAEGMPIYDYHCHLSAQEIYEDIRYESIGRLMLEFDHYKWRAMLSNGVSEDIVYGRDYYAKFLEYARMLKYAVGNPLFHWTHLELKRVFGIDEVLDESSAPAIWARANALLATDEFSCRSLIERFNVRVICTTDDPLSDLSYHRALAEEGRFKTRVLPTFRPDNAIDIEKPGFGEYIGRLAELSGVEIDSTQDVARALERRVDYFHAAGARLSDHGLSRVVHARASERDIDAALRAARAGQPVSAEMRAAYKTYLLTALGRMYASRGWAMQYHMNVMRTNNSRIFQKYGADTGHDSVDDAPLAGPLSALLDDIESAGGLPKTILYSLNPADNFVVGTMIGNFQGGTPGKIQMGSGWWFQDQRDGMVEQIKTLANLGLLGRFVGMLTDSRSYTSYTRHEYFRRILCDVVGTWVENGEYPCDMDALGELIQNICYYNAERHFDIEV